MKILLTGTSLFPSYGGPAFSVSRLAVALANAGVEVGLWASDQSSTLTPLLPTGSSIERILGTEAEALAHFDKVDILHDNGIWLPHNHHLAVLARSHGTPRVVSTRGMLEPWALNHKKLKKRLAWWLYQRRDLKSAYCHHATSEIEARNVQDLELGIPVMTIPNGVDVPENMPEIADRSAGKAVLARPRIALFLGRIYPIKGLPMLVEAWARVRPDGWHLRVAGPDEARHRKQLESMVSTAGLGDVVSFTGPIGHEDKKSLFFNANLFVLPSHSESFGMAVAEALAHGLPVLATTGAPWSILPKKDCGWWVDASVDGIAEGLRQATSLQPEALQAMGAKGRALVRAQFDWNNTANLMLSMYEVILSKAIV